MERLDQDPTGRAAERGHAVKQIVDQLIRQLRDEVALPVVAVDAVAGIEDPLLLEEALAPDAVVDETGHRAQRPEGFRVQCRPRAARDDDELQRERRIRGELGLDAELARAADRELAEETERLGNALSLVLEAPADDPLEWVEPELGLGTTPKLPPPPRSPQSQLGVPIVGRADDRPARADHLRGDQVVAGESVLGAQVTDPATEGETAVTSTTATTR